jgi:hypothetical protein
MEIKNFGTNNVVASFLFPLMLELSTDGVGAQRWPAGLARLAHRESQT